PTSSRMSRWSSTTAMWGLFSMGNPYDAHGGIPPPGAEGGNVSNCPSPWRRQTVRQIRPATDTSLIHPPGILPPIAVIAEEKEMATSRQRDLFDWITGFGSMQQRMRGRLARPVPDRRTAGARLSSAKLGWRNLGFEQLELAEGARVPAGRPGCHLVLLGLGSGTLVGPMPEGRALQVKPGSVLVLPAGEADAWKAQTALHCCLIYLDVRMLAQVAKSAYGASERDFEILALPIDYDFGVIGLAGVLAEEALRGIKGNNLYVNTLATHLAVHLLRHYASW